MTSPAAQAAHPHEQGVNVKSQPRPTAAVPKTRLQSRMDDAVSMERESRAKRVGSDPHSMGEIDRELTMLTGAIEGLHQRAAELVAILEPVSTPTAWQEAISGQRPIPSTDDFELSSEVGQRIREITNQISELESTLAVARHATRIA